MRKSTCLQAVVCATSIVTSLTAQAASEAEVEALKKELQELRQRYVEQQNALSVLEQRVRQVESQPAQAQGIVKPIQAPYQAKAAAAAAQQQQVAASGALHATAPAAPMASPSRTTRSRRKAWRTSTRMPVASSVTVP